MSSLHVHLSIDHLRGHTHPLFDEYAHWRAPEHAYVLLDEYGNVFTWTNESAADDCPAVISGMLVVWEVPSRIGGDALVSFLQSARVLLLLDRVLLGLGANEWGLLELSEDAENAYHTLRFLIAKTLYVGEFIYDRLVGGVD